MSKLLFPDQSYIEIKKSKEPGKILITIQAKDHDNYLKKITNCVEITEEQYRELTSDVNMS